MHSCADAAVCPQDYDDDGFEDDEEEPAEDATGGGKTAAISPDIKSALLQENAAVQHQVSGTHE